MKWLVLVHVLSAIIGVGPTFFAHVLLRRNQSVGELKHSMKIAKILEFFPKIGGTIAVLSGISLVIWSDTVDFSDLWIVLSIALYIAIQIVVIGFAAPVFKKLGGWLQATALKDQEALPANEAGLLRKADKLYYLATGMGTLLFIMMILKPIL